MDLQPWVEAVCAFVEDVGADSFAFSTSLTGAERAAVHKIARRCGLKAKSDGSEDEGTRCITLYRPTSEEERLRAVAVAEQKHAQAEEQRAAKKQRQQEKYPDEVDEAVVEHHALREIERRARRDRIGEE